MIGWDEIGYNVTFWVGLIFATAVTVYAFVTDYKL